jgi:hypothetical protein
MFTGSNSTLLVLAVSICVLGLPMAAESAKDTNAPDSADIVFVPPATGAPVDRLGAGTRDAALSPGDLTLLVPPDGGLSATPQPVLIWHLREPVTGRMTIAIKPVGGLARGFAATRDGKFARGFHALDLRRSEVRLSPEQLYQWEVVLTEASDNVARLYGSAHVEYLPVSPAPRSVHEAASKGLWYDALIYLFDIDFSGRTNLRDQKGLLSLSGSAGLDLTKALHGAE